MIDEKSNAPTPMVFETTTKRLALDEEGLDQALRAACEVLEAGGMVIFPTESFYGLGVKADNGEAVARLAALKSRSSQKPIPTVGATRSDVERIGAIPAPIEPLVKAFWPGPLTVAIEPRDTSWPAPLTGQTNSVGVRIPGNVVARRLAAISGGLITASSANLAGGEPTTSPDRLDPAVAAKAQLILDGGLSAGGLPSTVVAAHGAEIVVLRRGAISVQALAAVLGKQPKVEDE